MLTMAKSWLKKHIASEHQKENRLFLYLAFVRFRYIICDCNCVHGAVALFVRILSLNINHLILSRGCMLQRFVMIQALVCVRLCRTRAISRQPVFLFTFIIFHLCGILTALKNRDEFSAHQNRPSKPYIIHSVKCSMFGLLNTEHTFGTLSYVTINRFSTNLFRYVSAFIRAITLDLSAFLKNYMHLWRAP